MTRLEVLNLLAAQLRARTYLEIGVQTGIVFRSVNVAHRVGVDPDPTSKATMHMTSDAFFASLDAGCPPLPPFPAGPDGRRTADLIFIDGLHLAEQVAKDAANALRHLTPGGAIVFHDCDPPTEISQRRTMDDVSCWCGDTWRAWVALVDTLAFTRRAGVDAFTVDADLGLGVVLTSKGAPVPVVEPVKPTAMPYEVFRGHRSDWLRLRSPAWFRERLRDVEPLR